MKRLAFYASEMVANQAEPGNDWNFNVQPTYVIALTRFPVFPDERFKDLTESAKVSKFSKKEFEAYRNMYHKIWKTSLFFVANSKCKDDARSYDC